jgi:cytochrome c-type biogenesis protein CcmH
MNSFVIVAAVLAIAAATVLSVPLLWRRGADAPAVPWVAAGVAVAVLAGSALLYRHWSSWSWAPANAEGTPEGMVGRLARKLEKQPDDLQGWLLLGRSYAVLEQYPLAQRAYQRANTLARGRNVEALIGMGEALALANEQSLEGAAGRLFDQALAIEPRSGKALFYGAVAATRRNELPLARERFRLLLETNPPANVRVLIERQMAAIDATLAAAAPSGARDAPGPGALPVTVKLRVSITPAMAKQAKAGAALFVLIRDPQRPGPPLAARRLQARFPLDIELSPADAMIAGRSFGAGQQVEILARIANGGTPTAQRGDPVGQLAHKVGDTQVRELLIDHLSP